MLDPQDWDKRDNRNYIWCHDILAGTSFVYRGVELGKTELGADSLVHYFCRRFCTFNRQTMEVQIFSVLTGFEKMLSMLGCKSAHCSNLHRQDVHSMFINRSKKVRNTKMSAVILARKVKSQPLSFTIFLVNDQIIALRLAREVSINCLWCEQLFIDAICLQSA